MRIITRQEWGAALPKQVTKTTVTELFLHHSVGSGTVDKDGDGDRGDDYMRQMQAFHMNIRGWADIAYNHAYDPDGGEFYEGRGFGIRPGAQRNHNTATHALVVMGDFRTHPVSDRMIEDLAGFYSWAISEGLLPDVVVRGHRDAPNQETTCPGVNLYAALPAINELVEEPMPTAKEIADEVWAHRYQGSAKTADRVLWETRFHAAKDELDVDAVVSAVIAAGPAIAKAVFDKLQTQLG